jgi:HSP20 family protein
MVTRWDPYSEALSLRDAMNRLFEQAVLQPGSDPRRGGEGAAFAPALDVHEGPEGYTIKASLPGVKPQDVDIQYQQGVLTISGTAQEEQQQQQGTYHLRERRQGRFSRTLSLPDAVDADRAQAQFEHGVLTLTLPKAESTKPRRIQVQAGSAATPELQKGTTGSSGNGQQSSAKAKA